METTHEYRIRVARLKEHIQIENDNKRKVILQEYLSKELASGRNIAVHVIEEYNSITVLPF